MAGVSRLSPVARAVLFAAFVVVPSLGIVQKYFRTRGAIAYAGIGVCTAWLCARRADQLRERVRALEPCRTRWMAVALFASIVLAFALLYPLSNAAERSWISPSGIVGGGSDRDESLNLGVMALARGQYPYYERTQLGNPVSQMPGSLLLAMPFALLGNAAWQNLFWSAIYFVLAVRVTGNAGSALALSAVLLALSPIFLEDIVTGGDLVANSVVVLGAMTCLLDVARRSPQTTRLAAASAGVGVALSSRLSFLLLLPLLVNELAGHLGVRRTAVSLMIAGVAFAAITLPFYCYDPAGFAPMAVQNKFAQFGDYAPARVFLLPVSCVAFATGVAAWRGPRNNAEWLVRAGLVLLMPAALLVTLVSIRWDGVLLRYCSYAIPATLFGALGLGAQDV
jgi:uncharacterized membrane protein YidH (DUF202 family)